MNGMFETASSAALSALASASRSVASFVGSLSWDERWIAFAVCLILMGGAVAVIADLIVYGDDTSI